MSGPESVGRSRALSGGAISLLGVLSLTVPLWDMWDDVTTLSWTVAATAVENSPLLLLSFGLVAAGYWLATRDWEPDHVAAVAKWTLGVVVAVAVLYAWVAIHQLWAMGMLKPWTLLFDGLLVSAAVAFGIGVHDAHRRRYATDLEEREAVHRSLTNDALDASSVAMLVLDDSLDVVWATRAAGEYFGIDPDAVVGRDVQRVVEESIAPSLESPARFDSHLERVHGTDRTANRECHLTDGGEADRWLEHETRPIETGLYEGGRIEQFTDITEQKRAQQALATRERTLRELYDVVSEEASTLEEKLDTVVEVGCDLLDADYGAFTAHDRDSAAWDAEVIRTDDPDRLSGETPAAALRCRRRVAERGGLQVESRPYDGETPAEGTAFGFETYVGTPVSGDDTTYGSLCFLSRDAAPEFDAWQRTMVELMGNWAGYELQRERLQARLRRQLETRERELGSFVQAVDEYAVFRVDSDRRIISWNSGAEAITGYDRAEVLGQRLDEFFGEESAGGEPARLQERAVETGEANYQGWWTRRDGERFWADVSLTAESVGSGAPEFVAIARDMTTEREYERTIEARRERLEFLHRVLRHNLLNSLNVVQARAALLAEDGADENAAVIQRRVDDMIEFIARIRGFIDAITDESSHELSPVPFRETIEEKASIVADSHDAARFDVHDLPDESVRVVGDSLLGATVENVLSNAVVHNDEPVPRVEVWTTETALDVVVDPDTREVVGRAGEVPRDAGRVVEYPAVTLHVADNGPGFPEEEQSAVLEEGSSRLSEPNHGFGLYFVTELLDTYSGDITLRDNDPTGAVVELTFRLAGRADDTAAPGSDHSPD